MKKQRLWLAQSACPLNEGYFLFSDSKRPAVEPCSCFIADKQLVGNLCISLFEKYTDVRLKPGECREIIGKIHIPLAPKGRKK